MIGNKRMKSRRLVRTCVLMRRLGVTAAFCPSDIFCSLPLPSRARYRRSRPQHSTCPTQINAGESSKREMDTSPECHSQRTVASSTQEQHSVGNTVNSLRKPRTFYVPRNGWPREINNCFLNNHPPSLLPPCTT